MKSLRWVQHPPAGMLAHPDALLCVLVLEPQRFSRNRFFAMYRAAGPHHAHVRALAVRGLRAQLLKLLRSAPEVLEIVEDSEGTRISYSDANVALNRTVFLTALEASLLRVLMARAVEGGPLQPGARDFARVQAALDKVGLGLSQLGTTRPDEPLARRAGGVHAKLRVLQGGKS